MGSGSPVAGISGQDGGGALNGQSEQTAATAARMLTVYQGLWSASSHLTPGQTLTESQSSLIKYVVIWSQSGQTTYQD